MVMEECYAVQLLKIVRLLRNFAIIKLLVFLFKLVLIHIDKILRDRDQLAKFHSFQVRSINELDK